MKNWLCFDKTSRLIRKTKNLSAYKRFKNIIFFLVQTGKKDLDMDNEVIIMVTKMI